LTDVASDFSPYDMENPSNYFLDLSAALFTRINRPHSMLYESSNKILTLSGHTLLFDVVLFVSTSLWRIEEQKKLIIRTYNFDLKAPQQC